MGWAELGALYPTAGGLYGIVGRVLGRRAGLLALFLQLALFVFVPSAFALAAGEYVAAVWSAVSPRAAALVMLVAALAVTVAGIRFNAAVTAALLGAGHHPGRVGARARPCRLVGRGHAAGPARCSPPTAAPPTGLWTLLAGVALGMGAYAGYGGAVVFSEETQGPRRGIARAVLGCSASRWRWSCWPSPPRCWARPRGPS